MSDNSYQPIVHGDSVHAIAYALMLCIAQNEGKGYSQAGTPAVKADEKWVLETYAKCLNTVLRQETAGRGAAPSTPSQHPPGNR